MQNIKWSLAQWFELHWWKRYLRNKSKKDYLHWKTNYWKKFFEDIQDEVEITPAQSIIEFGCGPAGCFIYLTKNKIIAVDPLIEKYNDELEVFSKTNYPNTEFVQSTIEEFTPGTKADVVFCINAINHVEDIDVALHNVVESLKPKGQLIFSVDVHNHNSLKKLFRLVPADVLHPHQYNLTEYCNMLEDRGLILEKQLRLKKDHIFSYYVIVARKK